MDLKNHLAPFALFSVLGLYTFGYIVKGIFAWRRDGGLSVRNRVGWMPLGSALTTLQSVVSGDSTDDRPVHHLRSPVLIACWLMLCAVFGGTMLLAAYNFLRYGRGL